MVSTEGPDELLRNREEIYLSRLIRDNKDTLLFVKCMVKEREDWQEKRMREEIGQLLHCFSSRIQKIISTILYFETEGCGCTSVTFVLCSFFSCAPYFFMNSFLESWYQETAPSLCNVYI